MDVPGPGIGPCPNRAKTARNPLHQRFVDRYWCLTIGASLGCLFRACLFDRWRASSSYEGCLKHRDCNLNQQAEFGRWGAGASNLALGPDFGELKFDKLRTVQPRKNPVTWG